jgi:hypothetical protein
MVRKVAAASGLAKSVRSWCSRDNPRIPTGMVATMTNHAARSSAVSARRLARLEKNPLMIRTQSRQK